MKKLNPNQVARIKRHTESARFELKRVYESLQVESSDITDPVFLNSFYQIQLAIGALQTFSDNCFQIFDNKVLYENSKKFTR